MEIMQGKRCLITGANSGIGKETAKALAKMGAEVIMVCRNAEKGQAALAELVASTGNDKVVLRTCDLASLKQIQKLARRLETEFDHLDVLINNAGVYQKQRQISADGFELMFAVNQLAPLALSQELQGLLKQAQAARIVNVSSMMHQWGKVDFDDLQSHKRYSAMRVYSTSKLEVLLTSYQLARELAGTATVNALHPGIVGTNLQSNPSWARPFMTSPAKGAATSIYLASSPEVEGQTGLYFSAKKPKASSPNSYDQAVGERLVQQSRVFLETVWARA